MPPTAEITDSQLSRQIGPPHTPTIVDARADDDLSKIRYGPRADSSQVRRHPKYPLGEEKTP
jgi:hypothetical protein